MNILSRRALLGGLLAAGALPSILRAEPRPKSRPAGTPAKAEAAAPLALALSVDELIAKANLDAVISFAVLDAKTGGVLHLREADAAIAPASTLKSVTALYALAKLGPDHRFTTRVIRAGDLLVLAGGGDPELDSDALAKLAADVAASEKAAGRPQPKRFAVWGGALPQIAEIAPGQAAHLPYNPTISGMILNFNRVHLGWRRGQKGYDLSLEARGGRQSPRAYTVSAGVADRGNPLFAYEAGEKTENWTIARAAMGKSGSRWLPVRRPELYAGDVFQTLCRAAGRVLPAPEVIADLPAGEVIASRDSAPLSVLLKGMMEYSNNLTAEVVGLAASGKSNLVDSAAEMMVWLRGQGIGGDYLFRDHSGLSPANRITARMMAETLAGPGQSGQIRGLMKRIDLRDAKGKPLAHSPITVEAKTGTLNFVSNLAGFADDGAGREIIFTVLTGDEARRSANEGKELPDGVIHWTRRSKALQQGLIENWLAGMASVAAAPAEAGPVGSGAGSL